MKKRFLTIPNALTIFRIASAPMFLIAWFATGGRGLPEPERESLRQIGLWVCLVLACLSELSDLLDGWIARRLNQVSTFGKLMDPYADAIFRTAALLCFASPPHGPWYPLWMPILLVWRDIGTSIIRTFGMQQGIAVAASFWGKLKAISQGFIIIALLILALARTRLGVLQARDFRRDATIMMGIVVAVAVWALGAYLWAHFSMLRKGAAGGTEQED